jgi:hypothetical protein
MLVPLDFSPADAHTGKFARARADAAVLGRVSESLSVNTAMTEARIAHACGREGMSIGTPVTTEAQTRLQSKQRRSQANHPYDDRPGPIEVPLGNCCAFFGPSVDTVPSHAGKLVALFHRREPAGPAKRLCIDKVLEPLKKLSGPLKWVGDNPLRFAPSWVI